MRRLYMLVILLLVSIGLTACGLSDAETKYNSGVDKYGKKDLDGALADFNEAIRLDPNLAVAYMNRGVVYASKSDFDNAIADETKALDLKLAKSEDQATAYANRAIAYLAKQDPDKALADADAAVTANGNNAKAYLIRGTIRSAKSDTEGAIADFKKVVELDKNSDTGKAAQAALDQMTPTP